MKRVCVFCGSNPGRRSVYADAAGALGKELIKRGIGLVYGAGNIGLMSVVAETVLVGKGDVIGVIPNFMMDKELARRDLSQLHVVNSMHERKGLMANLSDAFVALPGGFGTLEEFFEMLTWEQLNLHSKPCGLLNVEGFYDSLLGFLDNQVQEGFVTPLNRELVFEADDPIILLDKLELR